MLYNTDSYIFDDLHVFRYSFSIIIAKVACEEFSDLHFLRRVVPDVIPHAWTNIVDKKSDIYSQPVSIYFITSFLLTICTCNSSYSLLSNDVAEQCGVDLLMSKVRIGTENDMD